jgi:hypothetical protein
MPVRRGEEDGMKTKLPISFRNLYDNCLYLAIENAVWSIRYSGHFEE